MTEWGLCRKGSGFDIAVCDYDNDDDSYVYNYYDLFHGNLVVVEEFLKTRRSVTIASTVQRAAKQMPWFNSLSL
jgi:hypothetical protein